MQDLVRIGVTDAGEEARIGQRALQSVILAGDARGKRSCVDGEDFQTARIERLERRLTQHAMQRCAALRTGLGERERAGREFEDRQRYPARRLGAAVLPAQSSRDHQMDDEEEFTLERNDDALAESAHRRRCDLRRPRSGHRGTQHERVEDSHPSNRCARMRAPARRGRPWRSGARA
jgi:hypothetical protein